MNSLNSGSVANGILECGTTFARTTAHATLAAARAAMHIQLAA